MTRKRRCEACGIYTVREQQYGVIERVVCNECSRGNNTDLHGLMDGVESARRDDGAESYAGDGR